jgi:hypothetical protein
MERARLYNILVLLKERVFSVLGWQLKTEPVIIGMEGQLIFIVETGKKALTIGVEYKNTVLRVVKPASFQENVDIAIVAAQHIDGAMMERLKANDICAIDEDGNYYFSYRSGRDRALLYEFGHKSKKGRSPRIDAFSPKAGYVVMSLLTAERFEIGTMRDVQAQTGVSLSGIFSICETMKRKCLISYSRTEPIHVLNPTQFLDEWAIYYKQKLAPKLSRQGYLMTIKKIVDKDTGEAVQQHIPWGEGAKILLDQFPQSALTGVQAAQSLSRFYSLNTGEILVSNLQLAERELGRHFLLTKTSRYPDLVLIEPYNGSAFIGINDTGAMRTAHPIQVYLDLVISDDPRANEFAEIYREKALAY